MLLLLSTFVGLDRSSSTPDYERGPMSVVLTCLHPADSGAEDNSFDSLSWLGPPKHVVELLFALGANALSAIQDKPVLPSVTRISPARYVLTFADKRARDRLLRHWQRYAAQVEEDVGWTPPFVLTADQVDEQTPSITARDRGKMPAPLDVRRDATAGTLWVGNERYTSSEALAQLVPPSTGTASETPTTERKRPRTELIRPTPYMLPDGQPVTSTSPVLAALEQRRRSLLFDPPANQSTKTPIVLPPRQGRTSLSSILPNGARLPRSMRRNG